MFVALCLAALVLAFVALVISKAANLAAWAVGALAIALLVKSGFGG